MKLKFFIYLIITVIVLEVLMEITNHLYEIGSKTAFTAQCITVLAFFVGGIICLRQSIKDGISY